jgi:hypothetical protein
MITAFKYFKIKTPKSKSPIPKLNMYRPVFSSC